MFAIIELCDPPPRGRVDRMNLFLHGYRGVVMKPEKLMGMNAMRVSIETPKARKPDALSKRIQIAVSALHQQRIRKLSFSNHFPYKQQFLRESFFEIDSIFLFQTMAGEIAAKISGDGEKTAAFFARRVMEYEERALISLCANYRYVMLQVDEGGSAISRNIRRKYGISVIDKPTDYQLNGADMALFFSPPRRKIILPDKCVAITVAKSNIDDVCYHQSVTGVTFRMPENLCNVLPRGIEPEPILSEALLSGMIRLDELKVLNVNITENPWSKQ